MGIFFMTIILNNVPLALRHHVHHLFNVSYMKCLFGKKCTHIIGLAKSNSRIYHITRSFWVQYKGSKGPWNRELEKMLLFKWVDKKICFYCFCWWVGIFFIADCMSICTFWWLNTWKSILKGIKMTLFSCILFSVSSWIWKV